MTQDSPRSEEAELRRRLAEAEQTVQALIAGKVDTVRPDAGGALLLRDAQDALLRSERLLSAIFRGSVDALLIADDEGGYVDANPAACELFGLEREELLGRKVHEFSESDSRTDRLWHTFLGEGRLDGEFVLVRPSGERRHVEFRARANILPGRHLSMLRDVTDRWRLEEQLMQAQKLEAVGRLAGGIAHDFNNTLTAILGFAEFIVDASLDEDPRSRYARQILRAADRASELTHQLLVFSRKHPAQPRVVCLNEVVAEVETMLSRLIGEDVRFETHVTESPIHVRIDAGQFEQVLVNLAVNARDAMPEGGTLGLRLEREDDPSAPGGIGWARVEVCDTGEGMAAETSARIFEPFFTTKPEGKGTGLGLSMVYGIVSGNGGQIEVTSEPGRGSTFTLRLPRSLETADSESTDTTPSELEVGTGTGTVLLVEDAPLLRNLMVEILSGQGYQVLSAADADDALRLAEPHLGAIDLLLTDVVMPGASGVDLARRLRSLRPSLKTLYMSGYTTELEAVRRTAGSSFLQKPFTPPALLRAVSKALQEEPA